MEYRELEVWVTPDGSAGWLSCTDPTVCSALFVIGYGRISFLMALPVQILGQTGLLINLQAPIVSRH